MRNYLLFVFVLYLSACTPKLYLGQNRYGYLTFNEAVYRGSKENIDSLLMGEKNSNYIPKFRLPEDVLIIEEHETYNYKPTRGLVIYRRNKENFQWARVTFVPFNQTLESIDLDREFVFVTIRKQKDKPSETIRFEWKPETPGYSEKWVKI